MKEPIPFRGFDESELLRIYSHGLLPHWRQAGCTYFVTFRLGDSIPKNVLRELEAARNSWLKSRDIDDRVSNWTDRLRDLTVSERREYERWFATQLNQSLDECHGTCLLRRGEAAQICAVALDYFHGQRVLTGDFVIMPNHVHALLTPLPGFELEQILHSIKSYSARKINELCRTAGAIWQKETYDHIVRDMEQLHAFQDYIRTNPVKAKLHAKEFLLSSADYSFDST